MIFFSHWGTPILGNLHIATPQNGLFSVAKIKSLYSGLIGISKLDPNAVLNLFFWVKFVPELVIQMDIPSDVIQCGLLENPIYFDDYPIVSSIYMFDYPAAGYPNFWLWYLWQF